MPLSNGKSKARLSQLTLASDMFILWKLYIETFYQNDVRHIKQREKMLSPTLGVSSIVRDCLNGLFSKTVFSSKCAAIEQSTTELGISYIAYRNYLKHNA